MKIYPHYSSQCLVNSYLVGNEQTHEAIIIDPGKITGNIIKRIENNHYQLTAVFITHNHFRHHAYGLKTLLKIYHPKVYAADAGLVLKNGSVLRRDCTVVTAGFTIGCFSVPGHSPDSYMFRIHDCIFTGDSLTAGVAGKTLHRPAEKNLERALAEKLFVLEDYLVLFPGHGPPTTLGAERQFRTKFYPLTT
ncbi:MAG: MBL fold metallo-hydrolase [Treponema sp.]